MNARRLASLALTLALAGCSNSRQAYPHGTAARYRGPAFHAADRSLGETEAPSETEALRQSRRLAEELDAEEREVQDGAVLQ